MSEYRRKDLDLSTRIAIGLEMLLPAKVRGWGKASELADKYGVSRSLLYHFKDRVQAALESALKPKAVGRPAKTKVLQIDRDTVRKAIVVMPLLTGSVRNIQLGLVLSQSYLDGKRWAWHNGGSRPRNGKEYVTMGRPKQYTVDLTTEERNYLC